MRIFHFHPGTLELLGEGEADPDPLVAGNWLIPAHATTIAPPAELIGQARHFIAGAWEYRAIPPAPPAPPAPTAAELRRAEIFGLLAQIDAKSIRALRESNAQRIAELEAQAATLRAELATL